MLGLDPLDRNDSQYGRLIENRLVEAIETSAPFLIESFKPVTDSGGYDWAGNPFGDFDALRLLQFKSTLQYRLHDRATVAQFVFDIGALLPRANTAVLFSHFEPDKQELTEPLWLVPSRKLREVATPYYCVDHRRDHYHFVASPETNARDRAAPYQVSKQRLADTIFPRLKNRPRAVAGLSPVSSEEGSFFELGFMTRFLRDCSGAEKMLRPQTDFGRDLLALTLDPFHWASLAIKGTALRQHGKQVIAILVKERTFVPHRRHFILVQFFDRESHRLHQTSWLIPSHDFAGLANRSSGMLQMVTNLNGTTNRWSPYAIPTEEDAITFMRWMRRPPPL